jgi:hypothetical protein
METITDVSCRSAMILFLFEPRDGAANGPHPGARRLQA